MKRLFDVSCTNQDCETFGINTEVLMHTDNPPECNKCGSPTSTNITKGASFILKGTGYYDGGQKYNSKH